jgi:hypothetical protein
MMEKESKILIKINSIDYLTRVVVANDMNKMTFMRANLLEEELKQTLRGNLIIK